MNQIRAEIAVIRQLLLVPHEASYTAALARLNNLLTAVRSWTDSASAQQDSTLLGPAREAAIMIQTELSALRSLFEAPVDFWTGIRRAGIEKWGKYERTGDLQAVGASERRLLASL